MAESIYTPNLLNQVDTRTVPGSIDVFGTAATNATVTVNFEPTERKGNYFHHTALLNNFTNPVFQFVTNIAVLNNGTNADIIATNLTGVYLPASQEAFVYDDDGNLLQDGRWNYTWNAENRLIAMEMRSIVPSGARKALEFQYDYQGRRIWKRETDLGTTASFGRKFAYDGWNLIAELDEDNSLVRSYIWGLDLSETGQGFGGIGGLLAVQNADASTHFVAHDGNGNVVTLIDMATSQRSAEYEYGPFGESLRATGPMAETNPFRFSTKYTDGSSLLYYGNRYYTPILGIWLNRDAVEELGGRNLYSFVLNDANDFFDPLGNAPRKVGEYTIASGGQHPIPVSVMQENKFTYALAKNLDKAAFETKYPHSAAAHPEYTKLVGQEVKDKVAELARRGINVAQEMDNDTLKRVTKELLGTVKTSKYEYVRWFDEACRTMKADELRMMGWAKRIEIATKAGLKVPRSWFNRAGKYAPGAFKILSAGILLNQAVDTAVAEGYGKAAVNFFEEATVGFTQDDLNEMTLNSNRFSEWSDKKNRNLYERSGLSNLLDWDDN